MTPRDSVADIAQEAGESAAHPLLLGIAMRNSSSFVQYLGCVVLAALTSCSAASHNEDTDGGKGGGSGPGDSMDSSGGGSHFDAADHSHDGGAVSTGAPRGLFVVDDGSSSFATALASNNVDGALVRTGWAQAEATEGNFDFTSLCNKVNQAIDAGKNVSIVNFAYTPDWLEQAVPSNELWTDAQFGSNVVPWSTLGQMKYREFVTQMANHVCPGQTMPLKALPAIKHVDAGILGIQGIRRAPSTDLATMKQAVVASIEIVTTAWGPGHVFYTTLFPITGCCGGQSLDDSMALRDAILAADPGHAFFAENWTGSGPGPSGSHAELLDDGASARAFPIMLQACGYWSTQSKIPCSFDNTPDTDHPLKGWDQVGLGYQLKYVEIYPADIVAPSYASDIASIHSQIAQ